MSLWINRDEWKAEVFVKSLTLHSQKHGTIANVHFVVMYGVFSPRRRLYPLSEPEAGLEALRAGLRLVEARSYASERSGAGGQGGLDTNVKILAYKDT